MAEDGDVEHIGTGYMRCEDGRATLSKLAREIRAEFEMEDVSKP